MASNPTILQNALTTTGSGHLSPEQIVFSSIQQQELQLQLEQYLAAQQQQHQLKQEYQARIEPLRHEIERQIVVDMIAQQIVQQEQEQLQAQQRHLLIEQAMQRQLLLHHQQQLRHSTAVPTQHHHLSTNELLQLTAQHVSSNSAIASFLQCRVASPLQQHQRNLMLQQLLMGIADRRISNTIPTHP
jgi:hypothetical protein